MFIKKTNQYERLAKLNLGVGVDENKHIVIILELNDKQYALDPLQLDDVIGLLTQTKNSIPVSDVHNDLINKAQNN